MNSSSNEKKGKFAGYLAWLAVVLVTVLAFFCTYYLDLAGPILAIVWLSWFLASMLLFYFTIQGKEVFVFAKEAKVELLKVVWPSRTETIQTTLIVMTMVAVTGFVLWGVDMSMMWIIGKITHLG